MKKWMAILLTVAMLLGMTSFAAAEVETIEVGYLLAMNAAEERDLVQQAINDLLDEKGMGFHVNLVCIDFASWGTQINLMLADGSIDLFNACFMSSVPVLADNGSIAPIGDLLNEYGKDILNILGDYIACATIGGEIYGTPKIDAYATTSLFFMDKKMADDAGVDPESITDLATLTEAFKKVKAVYPDLTMVANGNGGAWWTMSGVDVLGTEDPLGCLMLNESGDLKVVNYYESEEFKTLMEYGKLWNELGFFMKDPLNAQDGAFSYLSNGQAFGATGAYCSEAVGESVQEKGNGRDLYVAQISPDAWATTNLVTAMTWCVPALSDHKEAAVKFLNELYVNPELANLVCNGIEGKHYVVTEEGNIDFAEGLDAFTTGWPSGMGTFWPNITISRPWKPDAADSYDAWLAANETCKKSPALGFAFDAFNVSDEISACSSVVDQYVNALLLAQGDTEALYAEFLEALKDAGIDSIIEEKQAQLDAWAAI